MQPHAQTPLVAYLVPALAIMVGLFFRARAMSRKRPLSQGTLWVIPALFLAITVANFVGYPPALGDVPWLVVAAVLGGLLGWQRGRLMKIWVEPQDGQLMVQGSPWALIFLAALILLRIGLRSGLEMEAQSWAISPALINDGFVVFALGLFGVMRAEMALRAKGLREAHAAGKDA
jgi:hypothetical protein